MALPLEDFGQPMVPASEAWNDARRRPDWEVSVQSEPAQTEAQNVPLAPPAHEPSIALPPPPTAAPRLEALDATRWIASVMIIFSHFFSHPPYYLGSLAWWGGVWTQYFFVLSGFVLAYVEMARSPGKVVKMTMFEYVRKRLITVYPTYMLTVVLCIFQYEHNIWAWCTLPLDVFLLHSWVPFCWHNEESTWPGAGVECMFNQWATTSWFLSVLVVYWMVVRQMSSRMRQVPLNKCIVIILLCWLWSGVIGSTSLLQSHQSTGWSGESAPMLDALLISVIRFGPLGYIHVFVGGVATARLFILTSMQDAATGKPPDQNTQKLMLDKERAPFLFRYGCVLGYLLYGLLVYSFPGIKDNVAFYWFVHNGGMLPVMLLILLGGAVGADPLARYLFQTEPFLFLGRISYAQYLLQFNVYDAATRNVDDQSHVKLVLFPALTLFAFLVERFFTRTFTEWQRIPPAPASGSNRSG